MEFVVAHRALSRGGIGFVSRPIEDEAFRLLDAIELMWAQGRPRPRAVWRYLELITQVMSRSFSKVELTALSHASSLTSFSKFPIGLMTLPYDSSPLCCRVPIASRPLVPLTRALTFELSPIPIRYLKNQLRVLVAECIPADDMIGRLSRVGWAVASRSLSDIPNVTFRVQPFDSVAALRSALQERDYDILVISAHGIVDARRHRTGFLCGKEVVVEEELGPLPNVVCFSACQVSPRGRGTTNITDLMFRQGATVIIGTLVPIDVRRNATLMARFFANIAEALKGRMPQTTLAEVWQFTQASNAFNDILRGNASLQKWAVEIEDGKSVTEEFMLHRSRGRLRPSHMYRDTEAVLRDIAKDRGILDRFNAWINSQGYLPESLFYVVLGWPDRVIFHDPEIEKLRSLV